MSKRVERYAVMHISPDVLYGALANGLTLPDGVEVRDISRDPTIRAFVVGITGPDLPLVEEGQNAPVFRATFVIDTRTVAVETILEEA